MILKNDMDTRKLVVNCIPFAGQHYSFKIVSELLHCVKLMNNKSFKQKIIDNSNQLTNDEIYEWLKVHSSHVTFYRQETGGKLDDRVVALISTHSIPSGVFKSPHGKFFNVTNWIIFQRYKLNYIHANSAFLQLQNLLEANVWYLNPFVSSVLRTQY